MCAEVAAKRMGRPPLVVGGTCRRGHVIASEADLKRGKSMGSAFVTCYQCIKDRQRAIYHGLVSPQPHRLTTHFRCGHERTSENLTIHGQCRACHNARQRAANEKKRQASGLREAQRQRRQAIVAAWLAGAKITTIVQQYHVTNQRIRQIVKKEGGVTIRVLRSDLVAFPGQYVVVRNGGGV